MKPEKTAPSMSDTAPLRILIVDDEPANVRLMVEALVGHGFDLMTATNGADALVSARDGWPDLILLDILMPGIDGLEVCRRLKADPHTRPIPVIFLSALDQVENKLQAFSLGALDYITKPFDAREALARVVLHLDQDRLRRTLQQQVAMLKEAIGAEPATPFEPLERSLPARLHQAIQRVVAHLRDHLTETPTLDELANLAKTNRRALNEGFQQLYGISVFQWLREQRLVEAARLLRTTDLSIGQIVHQAGFESHSGLARAFRDHFGLTPSDYRNAKRR